MKSRDYKLMAWIFILMNMYLMVITTVFTNQIHLSKRIMLFMVIVAFYLYIEGFLLNRKEKKEVLKTKEIKK